MGLQFWKQDIGC